VSADPPIAVIDIFAGPGGLGEGFAAYRTAAGVRPFRVRLSIEMDEHAHRTLLLRSFFRQFEPGRVPSAYYEYLRGEERWSGKPCRALLEAFPEQGRRAEAEAWREELRPAVAEEVDRRIVAVLGPRRRRPPWVLVGGPPCQAYSLAGRVRMLGRDPEAFYRDKRHTLYREYLRLLAMHAPSVFIMENVKGLLSATSKSGSRVFDQIVRDLQRPPGSSLRYRLFSLSPGEGAEVLLDSDFAGARRFVVECERHGIPQARHRLIILGVLETDYGTQTRPPRYLAATPERVACRDAIKDLPRVRSALSDPDDDPERWWTFIQSAVDEPWFHHVACNGHGDVADAVKSALERVKRPHKSRGGRFVAWSIAPAFGRDWFHDPALGGACNHESRSHRPDDLHRYLFVAAFGAARRSSPRLADFPPQLLPAHRNVKRALASGLFNDRFRVQLAHAPATTITSHICKDGHYFIHYDPSQCRSLTVREAARLQTFPDNYFFEGPRTEQYRQVGNAVPPLLAREIAAIVYEGMRRHWQ
jgi:DNA (cytosine-5)-methyltransferase 1